MKNYYICALEVNVRMVMTDIEHLYRCFVQSCGITTDTRQCEAGMMFVALRGANFDGNSYAAKALELGCSYVVVDNPDYAVEDDGRVLLVDDSLKALQQLARHHRRQLKTPIVGITGTNGKTTTKELVALCERELNWKRTTTYTVIKRLEERGILKNSRPVITSLVTKDEVQLAELEEMMEKRFEGSLPAFVAAFAKQQNLSEEDVEEIRRIIDKGAR